MKVAIIKYNAGNIYSVDHALKRLGINAVITADHQQLLSADKVIFPGVGEAARTGQCYPLSQATRIGHLPGHAVAMHALGRRRCQRTWHLRCQHQKISATRPS